MTEKHSRGKIHLINDLPHYYELEDMVSFCRRNERTYIYGVSDNQEYLLKFFDNCGIPIAGYVTTQKETPCFRYRSIPVITIDEIIGMKNAGALLALPDRYYRYVIPKFRKFGFAGYFVMTEFIKKAVAGQMKRRPIEEMTLEVNLADHCNIACQMCDHYSQLAEERFLDVDSFDRDMKRMGKIFGHEIACISLVGGEPTLHKDIIRCMEITRREFPRAEVIVLTNGLLLLELEHSPKGNFWKSCKDLNVQITVTVYPINFDYGAVERKAAEYGTRLFMSSNIHADAATKVVKITEKHPFDLGGNAEKYYFAGCSYFNKYNVLKDGRVYMCPISAHIGIFNKYFNQNLRLGEQDSLDIYKIESWEEIAEFSSNIIPFCGYCDVKNRRPYSEWKSSSKDVSEYV